MDRSPILPNVRKCGTGCTNFASRFIPLFYPTLFKPLLTFSSTAIAVSQLCYKQGRISVPPALVLATNGFYAAPSSSATMLSPVVGQSKVTYTMAGGRDVDPPHWPAVRTATASMRELAKLYAGGWREVPVGARWWENAFAACEGERRERLVPFVGSEAENKGAVDGRRSGLSGGLEGVRGL
jgi:hypothetical protein